MIRLPCDLTDFNTNLQVKVDGCPNEPVEMFSVLALKINNIEQCFSTFLMVHFVFKKFKLT